MKNAPLMSGEDFQPPNVESGIIHHVLLSHDGRSTSPFDDVTVSFSYGIRRRAKLKLTWLLASCRMHHDTLACERISDAYLITCDYLLRTASWRQVGKIGRAHV